MKDHISNPDYFCFTARFKSAEIIKNVATNLLDTCENFDGPTPSEYIEIMEFVRQEADNRIKAFRLNGARLHSLLLLDACIEAEKNHPCNCEGDEPVPCFGTCTHSIIKNAIDKAMGRK